MVMEMKTVEQIMEERWHFFFWGLVIGACIGFLLFF